MSFICPSCWASLEVSVWLISTVCKYCNTISLVERNMLINTWEKSFIMPFPTVFEVGKYFFAVDDTSSNDKIWNIKVLYISEEEYNKNYTQYRAKFYVYGQIRYTNDGWFWDDFFVRIIDDTLKLDKNKDYILWENQWLINLYFIKKIYTDISQNVFNNEAGNNWTWYFIQEVWTTTIEWFQGSFPFLVSIKDNSKYINLLKEWKLSQLKLIWNDILDYSGI